MSLVVKGPRDIVAVYHFPKTSGEWVRETLRRINQLTVKDSPCREEFSRHCAVESWKGEVPKVGFTLVREPEDWIESWWRFNMPNFPHWQPGVKHPCRWSNEMVSVIGQDAQSFPDFVDGMLDHCPGAMDRMYEAGTKGVSDVFRMEHSAEMLAAVCEAVGVEKSADDLRVMVPPQNVSQQLETKWRRGQKPRFRAATKKAKAIYEKAK